jgi:acyl transferase domain-containing protein/acyl carrier protein
MFDRDNLEAWLVQRIAATVKLPANAIDVNETFSSFGLDSLKVATLAGELEAAADVTLDPTDLFEHPTISELINHLTENKVATRASARATPGEPIAIVGMACRLPGADSLDGFWQLLLNRRDSITEIPAARRHFAAQLEEIATAEPGFGGYLATVDQFDANFFRISNEEARRMDPQQRLLLETCWEAIEDSGEPPEDLGGTLTGVFVGISSNDYLKRQLRDVSGIGAYTASGNSQAISANRLSYVFDFHGPSLAVDTACSASLVATHLACRALADGDCDRAIVAGVNLLLSPEITVSLRKAGMLSPDGRCRAFDARANGYVRGEGVGVVILRPLSAALAANDRIYAVIRGTAVNQDGKSNGLTAPNPAAQRAVLALACKRANLDPGQIQYVECHGTGTLLGDPIEARSLGAVFRPGHNGVPPCLIGSAKTNVGHLEAAAGIVGLIKLALSLYHETLPASLHFLEANPHIPFKELGLQVVTETIPWPAAKDGRFGGVSSFGFGGTNAHVILGNVPRLKQVSERTGPVALPISARSETSLSQMISAWSNRLESASAEEVTDLAYTACVRKPHHRPFRFAISAEPESLLNRLRQVAEGLSGGFTEVVPAPRIAFVFSGHGAQRPGMFRSLIKSDSLFRSVIRRCDEVIALETGWSVEAVIEGPETCDFDDTRIAQPLIVCTQIALTELWRARGIEPAAVVGHSLGEISAAVVAGLLDLNDGLRLAVRRGQLMADMKGRGRMLAVAMSPEEVEVELADFLNDISLAAINSRGMIVLSGLATALEAVRGKLSKRGSFARWLPVDYAFHSQQAIPASLELETALVNLTKGKAVPPFYSTILGRKAGDDEVDASYWGRGVRETVKFADAVRAMLSDGMDAAIEISPDAVLRDSILANASEAGRARFPVLASGQRNKDERSIMLEGLCQLYQLGAEVRWDFMFPQGGELVSSPSYSWARKKYWIDDEARVRGATEVDQPSGLLGSRIDVATTEDRFFWRSVLDASHMPTLADHRVDGAVVLPASALLELGINAATEIGLNQIAIQDLNIHLPIFIDERGTILQTTLARSGQEGYSFSVHSRTASSEVWQMNASGKVLTSAARDGVIANLPETKPPCAVPISSDTLYDFLGDHGLEYGPSFRLLHQIKISDDEAVAEIVAPGSLADGTRRTRLIDAAIQMIGAILAPAASSAEGPMVPRSIESFSCRPHLPEHGRVHARIRTYDATGIIADVVIQDANDRTWGAITGLRLHRLARHSHKNGRKKQSIFLYEPLWRERSVKPADQVELENGGHWLIFADRGGIGERFAERLRQANQFATICRTGANFAKKDSDSIVIDPRQPAHYQRLLNELSIAHGPLIGVIHAWALDPPDTAGELTAGAMQASFPCATAVELIKALSFSTEKLPEKVWFVTSGAQAVGRHDDLTNPLGATLWGLLKAAPMEIPLLSLAAVDLDPKDDAPDQHLFAELHNRSSEVEIAYRQGTRFVRRLREISRSRMEAQEHSLPINATACYAITGGTGALGLLMATRLAARGARHIALISRQVERTEAEAVKKLRAAGVDIKLIAADVCNRNQLAAALNSIRSENLTLGGVIHAAGVIADGPLLDSDVESLHAVLGPKVLGAGNLHALTLADPLDWFIMFSSAAGILGSPGQANYAAANAYLDALAYHRRQLGLCGSSIAWGAWSNTRLAAGFKTSLERGSLRTGVSSIDPDNGLEIFDLLLQTDRVLTMVLPFDLRNLVQFYPAGNGLSFFEGILDHDQAALKSIEVGQSVRRELSNEYIAPRNPIEQRIAHIWQKSLGLDRIGVLDSFFDLGGDSVFGNQILIEINRALSVSIDPQRAFENFTVAQLSKLAEDFAVQTLIKMPEDSAARLAQSAAAAQPEAQFG